MLGENEIDQYEIKIFSSSHYECCGMCPLHFCLKDPEISH